MKKVIIEDGSPQVKEFVTYACMSAVVKSYPPALFSYGAKNPYTYSVYPKLFRRKQDIQNTHLKDWIEIANKQLIMHHSTQSAKKLILIEKYAYLRVTCKLWATTSEARPVTPLGQEVINKSCARHESGS